MASFIFTVLYFIFITLCMTVFTLVFCFVVYLQHKHKTLDHIPGPKRDGFFHGNIQTIERLKKLHGFTNGFEVFKFLSQEYGPVIIVWIFHIPFVYVSGAELVKKVLITSNLPKDAWSYDQLGYLFKERFMGKGLVSETDHEKWKSKRLAINPAFHRKYLKDLMEQFNASCDVFLARLTELADGKTEVKMADEFNRITLDIIGKVAFGIDLNAVNDPDSLFPAAIKECLVAPVWCLSHPLHAVDFTTYGYQNTVVAAVHFLRDTGKKIMDERRKAILNGDDVPSDILTYILKSAPEDTQLDYEEVLDHFITFFIAGQETTSAALSFMLAEAAKNPEVENKLVQEVDDILGSRQYVSFDDLGKLSYTGLAMKETLRLHPSVPGFTRVMDKDGELGGHRIPAGTLINIGVFTLHNSPKYWNEPEKFNPERFSTLNDENEAGHSHYAYIPFSLGPRHCIGQTFAEFEFKVLMSRFVKSFKFKLVPGQDLNYEEPKTTLSPKDKIRCTLTLR